MRTLLRLLGRVLLVFLGWLVFIQTVVRLIRRYVKFPAPPFITVLLDSRLRAVVQPPEQVVGWMDIREGMTVLELGPGAGTFTVEAARRAGPGGQVYAVDIQPEMIAKVQAKVDAMGLRNVIPQVAPAYDLPVPDATVDRLYLITVLAEIPDKPRALAEFRRVLKPGGLLAVGEFVVDPDYPLRRTTKRWCETAGFLPAGSYGSLLHYLLLFSKPPSRTAAEPEPGAGGQ